jgi:hypothetical protein
MVMSTLTSAEVEAALYAPRPSKRVYIASKFISRDRLLPYRVKLEEKGYKVLSTWMTAADHDETSPGSSVADTEDHNRESALRDCREVAEADIFILDTTDESTTCGREVEFGYALMIAHAFDPRLSHNMYRVGPVRNVFHSLVPGYDSWDELLEDL